MGLVVGMFGVVPAIGVVSGKFSVFILQPIFLTDTTSLEHAS